MNPIGTGNMENVMFLLIGWNLLLTVAVGWLLWKTDDEATHLTMLTKGTAEFIKDCKSNMHKVHNMVKDLGVAHNHLATDMELFTKSVGAFMRGER
jgi:hypothetical protein